MGLTPDKKNISAITKIILCIFAVFLLIAIIQVILFSIVTDDTFSEPRIIYPERVYFYTSGDELAEYCNPY